MGLGKRLVDLAKANINALLDKAGAPPDSAAVDQLSDEELRAELKRREERRLREADERRVRAEAEEAARRRAKERAEQAAREREAREREARARSRSSPSGSSGARSDGRPNGKRPGSDGPRRPSPPAPSSEKRLRELYAQLETPYGAPFEDVKKSFRRLMRKYHPDLHVNNPTKHQAATQLTASLTQAYNELERHLQGGRVRS